MPRATANYEAVMVFSLSHGDEAVAALCERFKSLIEQNGTITKIEDWAKRPLAYPINDETVGYYYYVEFTAAPSVPRELDRVLHITDGVLRSLIIARTAKPAKAEEAAPAEAPAETPAEVPETEVKEGGGTDAQ